MKNFHHILLSVIFLSLISLMRAADTAVPVPAIPEVAASGVYQVRVNGREVAVNDEGRFDFHTAAVCLSGTGVVEIRVPDGARNPVVRPLRYKITPVFKGNIITFPVTAPLNLVVEVAGQLPLAIFVTQPETDVPKPTDPHVLYFAQGVHEPGVIRPQSGQTVYLAPGALVKGRIEAKGVKNVVVKGRGVLDAGKYSVRKEKTCGIVFEKCSGITVDGIGLRGGSWWQTLFLLTDDAHVSGMNILGKTVNTDGIDIDGVKNFTARHCFIRNEDDGFGWHAVDGKTNGEPPTENCLAEDCVIWNTRAGNGLRIGASMETQLFQDITFRRIDVLKHNGSAIRSDHSDWAMCRNIHFEDFADETTGKTVEIIIAKTRYSNDNGFRDERGHYDGLHFVNLTSPGGKIEILGCDAGHRVDHVTFENCVIGGKRVKSLQDITTNEFVTDVSFSSKP